MLTTWRGASVSYRTAAGVSSMPPVVRALTLPEAPRLMPVAFMRRATRTIAPRLPAGAARGHVTISG
jgi:hypothetical protein